MPKHGHFGEASISFLILTKISYIPYFEGAYFESDICFGKFRAKISKFEPKSINLLILIKFFLYTLILKVLIPDLIFVLENFEPKPPNLDTLDQNVLTC